MIRRLPQLLLSDFWLKLLSLALALLIWFTVFQAIQQQGSPVPGFNPNLRKRTFYNLPVTPVSSSGDVRNYKLNPNEVQVTVMGDANAVDRLQSDDIKARVDLSSVETEGDVRQQIEVYTPTGLTCVNIDPTEVQIVPPGKTAEASR